MKETYWRVSGKEEMDLQELPSYADGAMADDEAAEGFDRKFKTSWQDWPVSLDIFDENYKLMRTVSMMKNTETWYSNDDD